MGVDDSEHWKITLTEEVVGFEKLLHVINPKGSSNTSANRLHVNIPALF